MKEDKTLYLTPSVKILEVRIGGIVCASTGNSSISDWENGGSLDF